MIIYHVLCTVPDDIAEEWRSWMLGEHIADVMNTEMFSAYNLFEVVKPVLDTAKQFCIQYNAHSIEHYERYRMDFAPVLQLAHKAKYGDSITVERMVMTT